MSHPPPPPSPLILAHLSQPTLLLSTTLYPLLFYLITPPHASPARFTLSREAISVFHCSFMTVASVWELWRGGVWGGGGGGGTVTGGGAGGGVGERAGGGGVVMARSAFANALTALETGYLVQDALVLVLGARGKVKVRMRMRERARDAGGGGGGGKGKGLMRMIDWRILGFHHAGLASALGVLQWYIARGKEKAVLVVLMLFLMNASTPPGTLHRYLATFHPGHHRAIFAANVAYLLAYATCRVYLIYWILEVLGRQGEKGLEVGIQGGGLEAWKAFRHLRWQCKMGTLVMAGTNAWWLGRGVRGFWGRYFGGRRRGRGI